MHVKIVSTIAKVFAKQSLANVKGLLYENSTENTDLKHAPLFKSKMIVNIFYSNENLNILKIRINDWIIYLENIKIKLFTLK